MAVIITTWATRDGWTPCPGNAIPTSSHMCVCWGVKAVNAACFWHALYCMLGTYKQVCKAADQS